MCGQTVKTWGIFPVKPVKIGTKQKCCKFSQNFGGGLTRLREDHNINKNKMSNFVRL